MLRIRSNKAFASCFTFYTLFNEIFMTAVGNSQATNDSGTTMCDSSDTSKC